LSAVASSSSSLRDFDRPSFYLLIFLSQYLGTVRAARNPPPAPNTKDLYANCRVTNTSTNSVLTAQKGTVSNSPARPTATLLGFRSSHKMTDSTVPQPGPAKLKRNAGPDEWLEAAKNCKYLSEAHMKQLCEIVKEYMMEGI
jgi:hypothetical protein